MTRTNRSARQAGTAFERLIADHLAKHWDDRIDRAPKMGSKDRGDIGGVRVHGAKVAIEAKNYGGRVEVGPWLNEAEIERGNLDAIAGLVIAKRRGTTDPGEQIVLMTVADLLALFSGLPRHTFLEAS